jgi:hypothetical protein
VLHRVRAWWGQFRAHRLHELGTVFRANLVQRWHEFRAPMGDEDENRRGTLRDRLKDLERRK